MPGFAPVAHWRPTGGRPVGLDRVYCLDRPSDRFRGPRDPLAGRVQALANPFQRPRQDDPESRHEGRIPHHA